MAVSLDFFQIYYDNRTRFSWNGNLLTQKEHLYNFAIPYYNESLTPYFENSVIAELVPKSKADLISVCSWRLIRKRADMYRLKDKTLTWGKIVNESFDIAILTPRSPSHKPLAMASHWHGKPWDDAIKLLNDFIKVPQELDVAIYENHFIAKKEIYRDYVLNCLIPCMSWMAEFSVFMEPSGYLSRKRADEQEVKIIKEKLGMNDWPIAPFILERLFSLWIYNKGFNIINL
jgi:hypothetical protein